MSAQTAALHFSIDLQTQTIVEVTAVVDAAHVILTQLESFQEVADTFNIQKVSSHAAPTGSFAVNVVLLSEPSSRRITLLVDTALLGACLLRPHI